MLQKLKVIGASLITILTLYGAAVVAQETQAGTATAGAQQPRNRGERFERRRMRRLQRRRGLRELNLTDQQKEQARAIRRANFESNKAQREELVQLREKFRAGTLSDADKARAKELREQLRQSRQNARTQMAGLLTTEQRTRLDEMIKSRRERRGRFGRGRRPGRTQPTTQNPTTPS
jgi:Spy/CpxP family protein refolding chaperone